MEKEGLLKEHIECPKKSAIYRLTHKNDNARIHELLMQAGKAVVQKRKPDQPMEHYLQVTDEFHQYFEEVYKQVDFPYEWSYQVTVDEAAYKWKRLMRYIFQDGVYLVRSYFMVHTILGSVEVPLLVKSGGVFHVYMLQSGMMQISNRAVKKENKPENSVLLAAVKQALAHDYPDAVVHLISLRSKRDTPASLAAELSASDDAYHSFGEYYRDGTDRLSEKVIQMYQEQMQCQDCENCRFDGVYCRAVRYVADKKVLKPAGSVRYTKAQMEAINHNQGPALVCACPGSGKTSVLLARIARLIEDGAVPEKILMLSFANSSVEDIKERLMLNHEGEPVISTIHALSMDILRSVDERISVEERSVRVRCLNELVKNRKIKGASATNLYGSNGFLTRLDNCICEMRSGKKAKFGSFDEAELEVILNEYEEIRKEKHYVTFDEMLEKALDLLKSRPAILRQYQAKFDYIMVDEFQDVDSVQNELINLLAAKKRNLMVVGDDDQAIYEFRGGSNKYMLEFKKTYPEAVMITLADNFRSTTDIVDFAGRFIAHNHMRLQKNLIAHKEGSPVEVYPESDMGQVKSLVNQFLQKGYSYGDIAIICHNNRELIEFNRLFGSKCSRLNRTVLCRDPIFNTIYAVLSLYFDHEDSDAFLRLVAIHTNIDIETISGKEISAFTNPESEYVQEFYDIWSKLKRINFTGKPNEVINSIAYVFFNLREHRVITRLENYMADTNVKTLKAAFQTIRNMIEIQDDTRVNYPRENRITLLTAHDSKGLEFPCVIVAGLEDFRDNDEGTRRLLYVAMTRAKEGLAVCHTAGANLSPMLEELVN